MNENTPTFSDMQLQINGVPISTARPTRSTDLGEGTIIFSRPRAQVKKERWISGGRFRNGNEPTNRHERRARGYVRQGPFSLSGFRIMMLTRRERKELRAQDNPYATAPRFFFMKRSNVVDRAVFQG